MNQTREAQTQAIGGTKLVIIAVVLALVTVLLTNIYISQVRKRVEEKSFKVFTLTRSVRPGDKMGKDDAAEIMVPARFEEWMGRLKALTPGELAARTSEQRVFQRAAQQGDVVTHTLFDAGETAGSENDITLGKRLITLSINSKNQPPLRPKASWVDIDGPFVKDGKLVVLPVMERVRVFEVGGRASMEDVSGKTGRIAQYNNIGIEVDPLQAEQLSMITRLASGEFELRLRNPGDTKLSRIPGGGINPAVLELLKGGVGAGRGGRGAGGGAEAPGN